MLPHVGLGMDPVCLQPMADRVTCKNQVGRVFTQLWCMLTGNVVSRVHLIHRVWLRLVRSLHVRSRASTSTRKRVTPLQERHCVEGCHELLLELAPEWSTSGCTYYSVPATSSNGNPRATLKRTTLRRSYM